VNRCAAPVSAPHSSVFARLASGAFYETTVPLIFYEVIKISRQQILKFPIGQKDFIRSFKLWVSGFKLWKMENREGARRTADFISKGPRPLQKNPDKDFLSGFFKPS
jgi:hypothetical protein